jgi:hypothetical protein
MFITGVGVLFQYVDCLPEKSNTVIHVKTYGVFFPLNDLATCEENLSNYDASSVCSFVDLAW